MRCRFLQILVDGFGFFEMWEEGFFELWEEGLFELWEEGLFELWEEELFELWGEGLFSLWPEGLFSLFIPRVFFTASAAPCAMFFTCSPVCKSIHVNFDYYTFHLVQTYCFLILSFGF